MKTIRQAIIGAAAILFASAVHTFAIEDIQLSVQSSNVLLSWPSATNETYIVQYLPALLSTNSWLTLTDGFPAALNTNLTVFTESNAVQAPVWMTNSSSGGTNIGGPLPPGTNFSDLYALPTTGFYRVVRDGVHIFGLTNGMVLSGNVQQPIEFAVNTTDEIVGVSFYDTNDDPVIGSYATPGPGGGWILNWNTTLSVNGNYAVEAQLDFAGTNVVSVPVTVTVSNLFSFPNYLTQLYGSQMWIYAQTIPNATVDIDMYDENSNYLGSFYPVESDGNGVISFIWDLTGGNGSTNFLGVFSVVSSPGISQSLNIKTVNSASPNFTAPTTKEALVQRVKAAGASPGGGSPASGSTVWSNEPKWTPNGNWVIGVGDVGVGSQVADQFVYGGTTSPQSYGGILGTLQNLAPIINTHIAPGNAPNQLFDPIQIVSDANTRSNLLAFLASQNPRYENFFWFGYGGGGTSISGQESNTVITAVQLAQALNNGIFIKWSGALYGYAQHPYRFAWVEGLNQSAQNIGAPPANFCEAFAIPAQDLSTNDFIAGGIMSRAFLGYKNEYSFDTNPSDGNWQLRAQMYSIFLQYLLQNSGDSLAALVYFAQNYQPPFSTYLGGPFQMDQSATSYGATDIQDVDNPSEPW